MGTKCHKDRRRRGTSEQELGVFAHYKIDKSQLCDAALAKLVSLHHIDRRTISGHDKWLPIGDIIRGR